MERSLEQLKMIKRENSLGKKCFVLVVGVLLLVLLSVFISADFGIGFANKVSLSPGGSIDRYFSLQNVIEPISDTTVNVSVVEGSKYVSFPEGTIFEVPAGETVSIPVTLSISSNARVGDEYPVKIMFNTIAGGSGSGGGTVQFTMGISKSFGILVTEKTAEVEEGISRTLILFVLIVLIILLLLIIWLIVRSKNK